MNIAPQSNRYNQHRQSFTAIQTPSDAVLRHFESVVREVEPEVRNYFVENLNKLIDMNSKIPVPIGHKIQQGYPNQYVAVVNGKLYCTKKLFKNRAYEIIDTLNIATWAAQNEAHINSTMNSIKKAFRIEG